MSETRDERIADTKHFAMFCDQTARDGIMPDRAWFSETATLLRWLLAEVERLTAELKVATEAMDVAEDALRADASEERASHE